MLGTSPRGRKSKSPCCEYTSSARLWAPTCCTPPLTSGSYREGLIELRGKCKSYNQYIALTEPVERMAFPSEHWVSRAIRSIGLRGRLPKFLRNTVFHVRSYRLVLNPPVRP